MNTKANRLTLLGIGIAVAFTALIEIKGSLKESQDINESSTIKVTSFLFPKVKNENVTITDFKISITNKF
ncbi:MAG: hypothetical protein WAU36_13935 [Cyclobacteriaceae bacterium]